MSSTPRDPVFIKNMVESAIMIGLLMVILFFSFHIIAPFILPIAWGAILAVALMPLAKMVSRWLGGRLKLAISLVVLIGVIILVVPSYYLADSVLGSTRNLVQSVDQGTFHLPELSERVKTLPLVGQSITDFWTLAQTNTGAAIKKAGPELVEIARNLGGRVIGVALTVLLFSTSLVIAGVFMSKADSSVEAVRKFARRVIGDKGDEWVKLSGDTISSVVAGVLGVAVIQAFLLAVGMFWLQVPGAGLLTLVALLFAIVQIPNLITMVPVIAYVYSMHDATPATIFAVWAIFGATSNLWLGPMLMGRGVNIPMLVVFLGAIGGMIYQGIIGLFVGAVALALVYTLYTSWVNEEVL